MGFMLPPSRYEIDHAAPIFRGLVYQKLNDGELPDTPAWRMLQARFDLAEARFTFFHPNIATMIVASRREQGGPIPEVPFPCEPPIEVPPCLVACIPSTSPPPAPDPGPPGPQIVPEPSSYLLMSVAMILLYVRRKAFDV